MAAKNGVGTTVKVDIDETGSTPDLKDICPVSIDDGLGEIIDTWRQLCDGGFSRNALVGFEPEFTFTIKYDDDEEGAVYLYENRYSIANRNDRKFEIFDSLTGDTINFDACITEISHVKEVDTIVELNLVVKMNGEPIITPPIPFTEKAKANVK